ncbi:MAG TPA: 4-(cytidine 5'-diphospho)-2-C-methyl-D-erythritol kinase [Acetobacteraceae bacterium]|nr:4-(cytidine 5'-diphospho)-2-C-methyl-D-erythritol kinase [Acetobacteraceae bacterium]
MQQERARAKVNLFLRVLGRRADGYHLLDSLAVFPDAADVLLAEPADGLSLELDGKFATALDGDNLVLRAARALSSASGVTAGARLVLHKNLPVASGIGGGSADAAAALRLLARLWRVAVPASELNTVALALGADVPVCLLSEPARMGGIGELLGIAPILPASGLVLANPGAPVSTAEVFRARDSAYSEPALLPPRWPDAASMADDLARIGNDLEAPAIRLCPAIGDALDWLRAQPGCLLARMSGSGATCFGLFAAAEEAQAVAQGIPPGWWGWGGALEGSAQPPR